MLNVGIIGFGGMGHVHAACYARRNDVRLAAIADIDKAKFAGAGMELNIGTAGAVDMGGVATYTSGARMLKEQRLDLVSICLPTDIHARYAIMAMEAGCHVLSEKPMARNIRQADAMIAVSTKTGRLLMTAQCLRFWPCYERLFDAHRSGEFGKLVMLSLRRVGGPPSWDGGSWFLDGKRSGGALLDLHVHDTDFVNHLLGMPAAVFTTGTTQCSGAIDNCVTSYVYPEGPSVVAECSWSYSGFNMAFLAIFEKATLEMGYVDGNLILRKDGAITRLPLHPGEGYDREIDYLVHCIATGDRPERCLPESTRESLRLALAEEKSARSGRPVRL